jgi:hypothetical protein
MFFKERGNHENETQCSFYKKALTLKRRGKVSSVERNMDRKREEQL